MKVSNKLPLIIEVFKYQYPDEEGIIKKLQMTNTKLPSTISELDDVNKYNQCIELVQLTVFKKGLRKRPNVDMNLFKFTTKTHHEIRFINQWMIEQCKYYSKTHVFNSVDSVYAYVREMQLIHMPIVLVQEVINSYLPRIRVTSPYERDEKIPCRYTCEIRDNTIYIRKPSVRGSSIEMLNQTHIDLGHQQNFKNKLQMEVSV